MRIFFWYKDAAANQLDPRISGFIDVPEEVSAERVIDAATWDWVDTDYTYDWQSRWVIDSSTPTIMPDLSTPISALRTQTGVRMESEVLAGTRVNIELRPHTQIGEQNIEWYEAVVSGTQFELETTVSGLYTISFSPVDLSYPNNFLRANTQTLNTTDY